MDISGMENTSPLAKKENHETNSLLEYNAPATVVVTSVAANSATLINHERRMELSPLGYKFL